MKKLLALCTLVALLSAVSCKGPVEPAPEKGFFAVSPKTFSLGSEGGDIKVEVSSTVDFTYQVESSCSSWIISSGTKAASSSNLSFHVAANDSPEAREGKINFSSSEGTVAVVVSQGGEAPTIVIGQKKFSIPAEGGSFSVEVSSNVDVSFDLGAGADWISSVGTKTVTTKSYDFVVTANALDKPRSADITFSNQTSGLSEKVTVSQDPSAVVKTKDFNPADIVCSFACLSDVHINGVSTAPGQKFASALQQLRDKALAEDPDGLDGVLVAGDLTDNIAYNGDSYLSQVTDYKQIYETVFKPQDVPMIYTPGNHDVTWNVNSATNSKKISKLFGDSYFLTDVDNDAREQLECRHCVVGDYHILCLVPNGSGSVVYPSNVITWLDNTLADITAKDPERYVLILTHPMIYDTVYGSLLGPNWLNGTCSDMWYTKALTPVLKKYPQAVTFSGHLHFPINDPRSIWQGDFTAFGCGSVRYMAIEDGKYENMSSGTVMTDCNDISSGLLVQIDRSGNMRITKMFFSQNTTFDDPWTISYPSADKSHLAKYNHAALKAANSAPVLSSLEVEQSSYSSTSKSVTAKFAAGTDDEFVHHYVLTLKKNGSVVATKRVLADFYRCAQPSQMKGSWSQSLGILSTGNYDLTLVAYDSWDTPSNSVVKSFSVDAATPEPVKSAEILVDIDFAPGSVEDKMNKVEIVNNGCPVAEGEFSHQGKKYKAVAMSAGGSKAVTCTFKEMASFGDMQAFAHSGFCIEAFFVDRKPGTAVHGVVCGTQQGGWGLALRATGVPYFVFGESSKNKYVFVDASSPASTSELTHVVAVYDFVNKAAKVYVNGKLDAASSFNGPFYPADGLAVNKFCLGDDVKVDGSYGDFPAVDMSIVDAKIYSGVMDAAGVEKVYSSAVGALKQ